VRTQRIRGQKAKFSGAVYVRGGHVPLGKRYRDNTIRDLVRGLFQVLRKKGYSKPKVSVGEIGGDCAAPTTRPHGRLGEWDHTIVQKGTYGT